MGMNLIRIALGVEYVGRNYCGFQSQNNGDSIQEALEHAASHVANHPIKVVCAGRTDAGVHALNQVIHFDTAAIRDDHHWVKGMNVNLPEDIKIHWVRRVSNEFHARYSAIYREYVYCLYKSDTPSVLLHPFALRIGELDWEAMKAVSQIFVGVHDFSAFRTSCCQAKNPNREIHSIDFREEGHMVYVHIRANAFLHHMIRKMMALLLSVGYGKISPEQANDILKHKLRADVPGQVPSNGLFLVRIGYASECGVPDRNKLSFSLGEIGV